MNKDEAERCTKIAKEYYFKEDYESALKFFRKSYRLHEDGVILDLIHRCEALKNRAGPTSSSSSNHARQEEKPARNENAGSSSSSSTPQSNPIKSAEIKKLVNTKDFYEILGVSKTATEDEIKKAYKKLALKFHPDKNKEPGADEAFKKLAQAYDCLMNQDKRKKYDEFGNEEPEQHYRHYRQYYNDDISPEDIFGMFFGNAFFDEGASRRRFVYRTTRQQQQPNRGHGERGHQHQQGNTPAFKYLPLLQFLPLLIIIFSSFALNFSQEDPAYSYLQTHKYTTERFTPNIKVQYFVDSSFNVNYVQKRSKLVQLEEHIEREYIQKLINHCSSLKQQQALLMRKADYAYTESSKQSLIAQARKVDLSSCEKVEEIRRKVPKYFGYYY